MLRSFRSPSALGSAVLLACFATQGSAQVDRAGLNGTVADASGRVLPQTHVTAIHNATGLRRECTSSSSGTYDIPELPLGAYTTAFNHDGFKPLTFVNVQQVVGWTRTLDATLKVSGNPERVEVSA